MGTSAAEDKGGADDDRSDEAVQQKGTRKVDAELVAVAVIFVAELEVRGYGTLSLRLQWLGDDADVRDAGLFDGIHDRGKGAEGYAFVGSQVDDALGPLRFARGFQ